jgi:hypothetical protein
MHFWQLTADRGEYLETVLVDISPVKGLRRMKLFDPSEAGDGITLAEESKAASQGREC